MPTDDTIQEEVEEDGDSPCCDDTAGNDEDEQIEHFLYDDDGKCLVLNQICNSIQSFYNVINNDFEQRSNF